MTTEMTMILTMGVTGLLMVLAFVGAGALAFYGFNRIQDKAFKQGERSGWRRSTEAPPETLNDDFDDDMANLTGSIRDSMGQNRPIDEFEGRDTDDIGDVLGEPDLMAASNFVGPRKPEEDLEE